jgi:aspartyl-tRNA synthetase
MYPVMKCSGNFFALNNILQSAYQLLQAFAVDKYFPASLCSGVRDEEPNDPQCSQMQKYSF